MNIQKFFQLLQAAYAGWTEDKAPRLGAALAYYTVFSLAPLLVVVIGVASLFLGAEAARGGVVAQIEGTVGRTAAMAVQDMLTNAHKSGDAGSVLASVVGLATVLLGAGALFGELQDSLNFIWKVPPRPNSGWLATVRARFVSFAMVLGTGFLLLVSLSLSAAVTALSSWLGANIGPVAALIEPFNFALSFLVFTLLFMAIFKVLPDVDLKWREVWLGAVFTSLLFTVGKLALGYYLGRPGVESSYGSAGALVVLLLWVYYAAQILFFGAEFTRAYATRHGGRSLQVAAGETEVVPPAITAGTLRQPDGTRAALVPVPTGHAERGRPPGAAAQAEGDLLALLFFLALMILWRWRARNS